MFFYDIEGVVVTTFFKRVSMEKKTKKKKSKKKKKDAPLGLQESFQQRLLEVLRTQRKTWWNKQLGVSGSLISARWEKGAPPKTDKILKICEITGISANWLLLGIGPKYINKSVADRDEEANRRQVQEYIIKLEETKAEVEQLLLKLSDRDKTLQIIIKLSKLLNTDKIALPIDRLDELSGEDLFNDYILPLIVFLRSLSDVTSKAAEFVSKNDYGKSFVVSALKWLRDEQEKNHFLFKGRLKELDSLFEEDDFTDLIEAMKMD